jgi:hypothetical protein
MLAVPSFCATSNGVPSSGPLGAAGSVDSVWGLSGLPGMSGVAGVGRMKMDEVTRGVLPFMLAEFAMLFVMVLFPQTVLVPLRWFY